MRFAAPLCTALAAATLLAACERSTPPLIPTGIEALSALEQLGTAGAEVAQPPAVRVTADGGRPVPGVSVTFSVSAGGGAVANPVRTTDERGEARLPSWRLGTTVGENVVTATISGGGGTVVTFSASARAGPPATLTILTQPAAVAVSGAVLSPAPAVRLLDEYGNAAPVAGLAVTASTPAAGVQLDDATVGTDAEGIARFTTLRIHGPPGDYSLTFSAAGLTPALAAAPVTLVPEEEPGLCSAAVALDFNLGEMRRVTLDDARGLDCLDFDLVRNAGQQYLLLFENMPMYGLFENSLFSAAGAGQPASPREFSYTMRSEPRDVSASTARDVARRVTLPVQAGHAGHGEQHSWDFGDGPIHELRPDPPPGGVPEPWIAGAGGRRLSVTASGANPQVGDTIHGIWMVGIPRLNILQGAQSAVIRHISPELIIAEDVRLATTLRRATGALNQPIPADTMAAIAEQYALNARVQGDMLFAGQHNAAVTHNGGRVLAVHSLMYADNIWGYTFSSTNYFVFDYWVATDNIGPSLAQQVLRVVDNLFMHEIAHMREVGLLQQNGFPQRGNQWLVEGFAAFAERQPIAARLLGMVDPPRTDNLVLPTAGNWAYRSDVPPYLNVTDRMTDGYSRSSYVFDYFADHVAARGGDWRRAVREFVVASGRPAELDNVTTHWLGMPFPELFTRSRLALYLDEIHTDFGASPELPAWTQYLQFQLRASRPRGGAVDPRTYLRRLIPGGMDEYQGGVVAGGAWGFLIDGLEATASARFNVEGPPAPNAVLSITRIR